MLRAIIFDLDGVLVDSEPLIFELTQEMAAKEGWTLTEEEYFRHYLGLDDREILRHLYRRHGRAVSPARLDELIDWKARTYANLIRDGLPPVPGAIEFVRRASAQFPLAVASGSQRAEVEHLLAKIGVREEFQVLATVGDRERSKPAPDVFLKALEGLQGLSRFRPELENAPLHPTECLAVEDAPNGIEAAHSAGMRCLAVAHSRPPGKLRRADWVFRQLADVDLEKIRDAFSQD